MPRKASKLPKFTGSLAKPIKRPPARILIDGRLMTKEELSEETNKEINAISGQRLEKMKDLLRFYGWKSEGPLHEVTAGVLFFVLYRMACDFVPGFQVTDKGGGAGRPKKHDADSLKTLLMFIDVIKTVHSREYGRPVTDLEACEFFAESQDRSLVGARNASARMAATKTLANLVSQGRASAKRKAEGKVH